MQGGVGAGGEKKEKDAGRGAGRGAPAPSAPPTATAPATATASAPPPPPPVRLAAVLRPGSGRPRPAVPGTGSPAAAPHAQFLVARGAGPRARGLPPPCTMSYAYARLPGCPACWSCRCLVRGPGLTLGRCVSAGICSSTSSSATQVRQEPPTTVAVSPSAATLFPQDI